MTWEYQFLITPIRLAGMMGPVAKRYNLRLTNWGEFCRAIDLYARLN